MSFGAEVATAFVKIRPQFGSFNSELSAGVRGSLGDLQAEVASVARANVSASLQNLEANRNLAASYKEIGAAAEVGSDEARVAARLGAEAQQNAAREIKASFASVGEAAERAGVRARVGFASSIKEGAAESEGALSRLKERFLNLGTVFGVGFGAVEAVKFTKEITGAAANVQKSMESIRQTFGADATKVVVGFGDTVAAKLGISAQVADATSARFGILFQNLGIGQGRAAQMTVGLESLAGSLSAIRGLDPAAALGQIGSALLGNTRSLKQLGLSVDPAVEKIAAFKLGLISSIKDGMTPAVRAQAIYALATAHLGEFQREAAAHGNDYANVQRRLSAEFSNAKDVLGTALLPAFKRYSTELANWLQKGLQSGRIQKDINHDLQTGKGVVDAIKQAFTLLIQPVKDFTGAVGGAGNAIKILFATLVVSKLATLGKSIVTTLITNGIALVGPAAEGEAVAYGTAMSSMELATVGLAATIKSALISTGIGALVVAVGIAAVEIINHWNTVKTWLISFGQWIESHAYALLALPVIGEIAFMAVEVIKHWNSIKTFVVAFASDIKELFVHPLAGLEDLFRLTVKTIEGLFESLGKEMVSLIAQPVLKILDLLAAIPSVHVNIPEIGKVGFTNPFGKWRKELKAELDGFTKDASKAPAQVAAAAAQPGTDAAEKLKKSLDLVVEEIMNGKRNAMGLLADLKANLAAQQGTGTGAAAGTGGGLGDAVANSIFNQSVRDAIASAKQRLADAILSGNQAIASAQQSLSNYTKTGQQRIADDIKSGNQKVTAAAESAASNLNTIGKKLSDTIGKYLSSGADAAALAKGPLGQQFQRLRQALLSGHGGPELINSAQALATELQSQQAGIGDITKKKAAVTTHVANLTDELNRGLISVKTFHQRVLAYLASQGISYTKVGKALGKAQGDAYLTELNFLLKQAGIISNEPKALRDIVNKSGANTGVKIIDPAVIRDAAERKKARDKAAYDRGLGQHRAAVVKAQSASDRRVAAARHAEKVTLQKEHLRAQQHAVQLHKKQAAAAAKTAKAAAATAATNAAIAATTVNTSGYPSATTKNPGVTANKARVGAAGGLHT